MQNTAIIKDALFFVLFLLAYYFFELVRNHKLLKEAVESVYERTREQEERRLSEQERIRLEEGVQEKTDFLYKLDMLLVYSNIKKWIPFMNTELFIGMTLILSVSAYLLVAKAAGVWIFGILGAGSVCIGIYLLLYFLSGINYQNTEKSLTTFLNLLENYSITSDDLIHILHRTAINMEEPIQSALYECYAEATSTGNTGLAMRNLQKKIEHEKFKELVRNLEICSRYEANYAEIIKDSRSLIQEHSAYSQERKSIINNARIEIMMIVGCCGLVFWMVDDFSSTGILNALLGTTAGNVLLLYCVVMLLIALWTVIAVDKH